MRIGIDLGGSKIEVIALDEAGAILLRKRAVTPKDDAAAIVTTIRALVIEAERQLGASGQVGIATPGAISSLTGLLKNSNTTCLNGTPLDRLLGEALEREVRLDNDANCFALSEAVDGAGAGARERTGHSLDPKAAALDPTTLSRYADRLARGLASVVNVLDPDVIVLGGRSFQPRSAVPAGPRADAALRLQRLLVGAARSQPPR